MKEEEEEEGGGIFGHRKFKIQLFHPNARFRGVSISIILLLRLINLIAVITYCHDCLTAVLLVYYIVYT